MTNLKNLVIEAGKSGNYELAGKIRRAINDIESLKIAARSIKSTMDTVISRCEKYDNPEFTLGINSLGELQSRGSDFDIRCAMAYRSVEDMKYIFDISKTKEG